jgi:hypothetical protein
LIGYDEPEILLSQLSRFCLIGADAGQDCGHTQIAYNSYCNRHCPKCQGAAARDWPAEREAELLPVPYFHLVRHMTRLDSFYRKEGLEEQDPWVNGLPGGESQRGQ